jgi:hypothetical protein
VPERLSAALKAVTDTVLAVASQLSVDDLRSASWTTIS